MNALFVFATLSFHLPIALLVAPYDVVVRCTPDVMGVFIEKDKVREGQQPFTLLDPRCYSKSNETHIFCEVAYGQCGTKRVRMGAGYKYMNTMSAYLSVERCPVLSIDYSCFFNAKRSRPTRDVKVNGIPDEKTVRCQEVIGVGSSMRGGVLAGVHLKHKRSICPMLIGVADSLAEKPIIARGFVKTSIVLKSKDKLCAPIEGDGEYKATMQIFSDNTFKKLLSPIERGLIYSYHRTVFYEIAFFSDYNDMVLSPMTCYATPTPDADSNIRYTFIENGCATDRTLRFYDTGDDTKKRFSLTGFKFKDFDSQFFYSHCTVAVCSKEGDVEKCNPTCYGEHLLNSVLVNDNQPDTNMQEIVSEVECLKTSMKISLKKPLPTFVDASDLHLRDLSCVAMENNTHVTLHTYLHQCGTTLTSDKGLVFTNVVLQTITNGAIVRTGPLAHSFSCRYPNHYTSVTSITTRSNKPNKQFRNSAFGSYDVNIALFTDETFSNRTADTFAEIDSNSRMYFEVSINSQVFNLALFLDECFGIPLFRTNNQEKFSFIQNGCPKDDTLLFYDMTDVGKIRFSIMPFKFDKSDSNNILINCFVTACNANDAEDNVCTRGCAEEQH